MRRYVISAAIAGFMTMMVVPAFAQIKSEDKAATSKDGAWSTWNNLRTDARGGVRLLSVGGDPVRATKLRVYAQDVDWQWGYGVAFITSPLGTGTGNAPSNFTFPGLPVMGIVLFQGPVTAPSATCALSDTATSPSGATICAFSNDADIWVTVNDGVTDAGNAGHDDNGGSFDIIARVVER